MVPEANPRAQHARNSRRGGINSYLRGRGSRSERGPVCACVRVCARARLARAPSPHSMSPTHFHGASASPPPSAAPATGSAQGRPRPTPARAPLIEPGAHQSAPPLPVLGRLPAPAGRCHYHCSSRPRRGRRPHGSPARQQCHILPRPGLGEGGPATEGEGRGVAAGLGARAPSRASVQESPGRSYARVSPERLGRCSVYFCVPSSPCWRFPPESRAS